MLDFKFASGTIRGRDHTISNKNNQDAFYFVNAGNIAVGVVCDGCGDPLSPYSEFGALLGSRVVVRNIYNNIFHYGQEDSYILTSDFWNKSRKDILDDLVKALVVARGPKVTEDTCDVYAVRDLFLFTTVGFIMTPSVTVFFTLGDGTIYLNGSSVFVDKYEDNAPPYIAYNFIPPVGFTSEDLSFNIRSVINTQDVQSFLIGSDGCDDIVDIWSFWIDDQLFDHKDAIKNRLNALNKDKQKIDWNNYSVEKIKGSLHDDTTMIVCKRIE